MGQRGMEEGASVSLWVIVTLLMSVDRTGRGVRGSRWANEDQPADTVGARCAGVLSGWSGEERGQWEAGGTPLRSKAVQHAHRLVDRTLIRIYHAM